ncbi:MAG TPA: energy-coupling factor transporter ATPase [Anaerolineae bacterium]|nr:energy-coupling factor transporter ATPase [Anaerolineae bacterium]
MNSGDPIIRTKDLCFKPLGSADNVLKGVNLELRKGDFALLLGPSGCGKSTLILCLNGLIPHLSQGEMTGVVEVAGKDTSTHEVHDFSPIIGMVFQNPDDQILSLRVVDEVAFGVEQQGLPHDEIVQRVDEFMEVMEISHLKNRLTFAISGGQKQRVSIASNLVMLQEVLILDDPTTDLDPVGKAEIVSTLGRLQREMGKTLLVIEHDLTDLIELANRVIVMEDGRVVHDGSPSEVFSRSYDDMVRLGVNLPQHVEMVHALSRSGLQVPVLPVLKEEAFAVFKEFVETHPSLLIEPQRLGLPRGEPVVSVRDLEFSYDPGAPILRKVSFDIRQGEFVAIIGANGSGKSTLVNNLVGLLRPDGGQIIVNGHDTRETKVADLVSDVGYVFQNPDHQLFANTVEDELRFSLRVRGLSAQEVERRVTDALGVVGLEAARTRHPFSLSRGQRQNLAVATALIHDPKLILLDEPTTGQDRRSLSGLLGMLSMLNKQGNTTIMITHDMDIVAAYATRVIVMADGQIIFDGHPRDVFYDQFEAMASLNLRPPTIVDFCRRLEGKGCPRLLIVDELVQCLEGGGTRAGLL